MLKNGNIIEKLNPEEKASVIADSSTLFAQGYAKYGIPRVAVSSVEEVNREQGNLYPPFNALANSWNTDLISSVAKDLAARARDIKLLKTSPVRVKSNPYVEGLSEDPCAVSSLAYGILNGIREGGAMPCLCGTDLTDADFRYTDTKMDFRTVRDYFLSPYKALSMLPGGVAVSTELKQLEGAYSEVNTEALSNMLTVISERRGGYVISENIESDDTVKCAVKYTLAVGGNPSVLSQAISNYEYIKESINTGNASGNDLDSACRDYSAVSGATVDELCDKVIGFALDCNRIARTQAPSGNFVLSSAEESIVLLKNTDNLLPLRKRCKIAIVGDPAFSEEGGQSFVKYITSNGNFEVVGTARGYDISEDRSDKLLSDALGAVKGAEVVLVFLANKDVDVTSRKKLPANRIALIDALSRQNKKIIAVIPGNTDMGFDTKVQAALVAPFKCVGANEALTDILRGAANPSGKLAETYYENTDAYFDKIRSEVKSGKKKVGGFIGYRYYDAASEKVKYPFGHGLSYTTFKYTDMTVSGDSVSITVKNTGRRAGAEVIQLYVGKHTSNVVRPAKELKGFIKVYLKAGESKTVRFMLNTKNFSVYDPERGKNVVEGGDYTVYACSSVTDVKKSVKMHVLGIEITPDGKRLTDYVKPAPDVLSEGYMLKDVKISASRGKGLIAWSIIVMIIALLGLGIMFALHFLSVIDITAQQYLKIIFISFMGVFGAFLFILIIGIVLYAAAKKRAVIIEAKRRTLPVPAHPFETLFEKEFKVEEEEEIIVKDKTVEVFDEEQEALRHIDNSLKLDTVCSDLVQYCVSRGMNIDSRSASKLISALISSRLVILRSRSAHLLPGLIKLLNGFFGTEEYVESFSGITDPDGFIEKTLRAVQDAKSSRKDAYIAGITNVNSDNLRDIMLPLMKYIISPNIPCTVRYGYNYSLEITPNVWYVLAMDGNARVSGSDTIILNSASVIDLNVSECPAANTKYENKRLSYYQLMKFASVCAEQYPLDEEKCWKKIDRLEKFVASRTPYRIGNKITLRAERFASSVIGCGGSREEALDATIASILLPSVISLLDGKISPEEEQLANVIENLLGEEHSGQCKKVLNSYGLIR